MELDISVESRSGDTSSDKKARQRSRPPNILLTTPESLSLLLSYPDSFTMFADLKTVVIDEIHAFAPGQARRPAQPRARAAPAIAPALRRVGLSATIADTTAYRSWLAPDGEADAVTLVEGEARAPIPISRFCCPKVRCPGRGIRGAMRCIR
jgi:ATP-dependent Lhr-like helicase